MSTSYSPKTVTDGLILCLDAANTKSYPGSGTTWYDLTTNASNCTLTNGPSFQTTNKGIISFDGANDYASLPTISSTTAGFSITLWINASRWALPSCPCADVSGIVDWSTGYWNYASVFANAGGPGFVIYNQSSSPVGVSVGFGVAGSDLNRWYHLVSTFGPSPNGILKTYTNGAFISQASLPGNNGDFTVTAAPSIAAYNRHCGTCYLEAKIAHLSFYNRPITASEVLQNYNSTKGRFGL